MEDLKQILILESFSNCNARYSRYTIPNIYVQLGAT